MKLVPSWIGSIFALIIFFTCSCCFATTIIDTDILTMPPQTGPTASELIARYGKFTTNDGSVKNAALRSAEAFDKLLMEQRLARYKLQQAVLRGRTPAQLMDAMARVSAVTLRLQAYKAGLTKTSQLAGEGYKLQIRNGKTVYCNATACISIVADVANPPDQAASAAEPASGPASGPATTTDPHPIEEGDVDPFVVFAWIAYVVQELNLDTPSRLFGSNNDICGFFSNFATSLGPAAWDKDLNNLGITGRSDVGKFLRNPGQVSADAWNRSDPGKAFHRACASCGF